MRISDWSSDVCSSDLLHHPPRLHRFRPLVENVRVLVAAGEVVVALDEQPVLLLVARLLRHAQQMPAPAELLALQLEIEVPLGIALPGIAQRRPAAAVPQHHRAAARSEEHTSELQSLMRLSYAAFCLQKKKNRSNNTTNGSLSKYNIYKTIKQIR